MRALALLAAVICVATVTTQALALGMLWWHGRVTADTVTAVREALEGTGEPAPAAFDDDEPADAAPPPGPTHEEVLRARALAVLNLRARSEQLDSAAAVLLERADAIIADRQRLAAERRSFREELDRLGAGDRGGGGRTQPRRAARSGAEGQRGLPDDPAGRAGPDGCCGACRSGRSRRYWRRSPRGPMKRDSGGRDLFAALSAGEPERAAVEQAAAAAGGTRR